MDASKIQENLITSLKSSHDHNKAIAGVLGAYRVQSKWYPISRDTFNVVTNSFIGLFKLFCIIFNLVPYVALLIIEL